MVAVARTITEAVVPRERMLTTLPVPVLAVVSLPPLLVRLPLALRLVFVLTTSTVPALTPMFSMPPLNLPVPANPVILPIPLVVPTLAILLLVTTTSTALVPTHLFSMQLPSRRAVVNLGIILVTPVVIHQETREHVATRRARQASMPMPTVISILPVLVPSMPALPTVKLLTPSPASVKTGLR